MTLETETILIKLIEEIKAEGKETNRKLDRVIENVNEVKLTQGIQGEQIKSLQKGQDDFRTELKEVKTELKEVRTELKETKNEVSGLYKWVIGLIVTSGLGITTLLLKAFDLFPKA